MPEAAGDRQGGRSPAASQAEKYDEWGKLIEAMCQKTEENDFKDNKEILTRMIKSTTGEAQATSDNVLVWAEMADEASLCSFSW